MPGKSAEVIHRWFEEVWNNKREDLIEEMLAPDAIAHGLTDADGNTLRGSDGFRGLYNAFCQAYPDIQVIIEDTVEQDNKVVVLCKVVGRHTGEGIGVAPTKRKIEFTGICMARIEDGRIAEAWNQYDFMSMYNQLGVLSLTLG